MKTFVYLSFLMLVLAGCSGGDDGDETMDASAGGGGGGAVGGGSGGAVGGGGGGDPGGSGGAVGGGGGDPGGSGGAVGGAVGGGGGDPGGNGGGVQPGDLVFRLDVSNDIPESIWVQLLVPTDEPGWIKVYRGPERLRLDKTCTQTICDDLMTPGCGDPPPQVRDITGDSAIGMIERGWDRQEWFSNGSCLASEEVVPGDYEAEFCWSLDADLQGDGDPLEAVRGTTVDEVCERVPFSMPREDPVVFTIMGG